ncbi:MAG: 1,6-anhydro-N-acetylmuramyl-L-alanine amidase AmpD [Pseudomonadales bacterium]
MEIANGLLSAARFCASPNCDERPGDEISLIVVHSISLPAGHFGSDYIESLFCNRLDVDEHPDFVDLAGLKVSSHVLIRRDGYLLQFVPFDKRAWHAGESCYMERTNCNDFSIGIELEGTDKNGYRGVQYDVLARVCQALCHEYGIVRTNIVGHSDIAPGRKTDPGPGFDWPRLRTAVGL